jgi:hypothetical protein
MQQGGSRSTAKGTGLELLRYDFGISDYPGWGLYFSECVVFSKPSQRWLLHSSVSGVASLLNKVIAVPTMPLVCYTMVVIAEAASILEASYSWAERAMKMEDESAARTSLSAFVLRLCMTQECISRFSEAADERGKPWLLVTGGN